MDDKDRKPPEDNSEESNAARRIRILGQGENDAHTDDEPIKINKWANFWYHHKWKVVVTAAFAFIIIVAVTQFAGQQNPDISIIYAGPTYITPNENQLFCDNVEALMPDYDEDGRKYVQLNDLVFMTENQMTEILDIAEANAEDVYVDPLTNRRVQERFTYEIFGGEAAICILAEDQYKSVMAEGGFVSLAELFPESTIPEGAVDEYGIRFSETKFCKFYQSAQIFPDDAVIALRKVSTMSAFTGKKKAERLHANSRDLFTRILTFQYPEGYTP